MNNNSMNNNQNQPVQIPAEIRNYLEKILEDAGIVPVNEAVKQHMIQELFVELDRYTAAKIIETMPIEHMEAFLDIQEKQAANGQPSQELEKFILEHVPNAEQVYIDSFAEFRNTYLASVSKARAAHN